MLLGRLYGPADLYYGQAPWQELADRQGIGPPANPILSDLAFANLPWRAAVREALANGRFPFWNRFLLGGTPLLAAAQAGVFHPSTWLAIWLPVPLSWTFSCAFTLFLALLSAYLFLRDFRLSPGAAAVGAVGWGFSTYLVFWDGWSVGPATGALPLLLLGLRRMASGGRHGIGWTVTGLLLSFSGGHPESFLHVAAAGSVAFLWELAGRDRRAAVVGLRRALAAGALALLLAGPQLFPLLEAIPLSAEYRARRAAVASGRSGQSVSAGEAARRLLPAVLPFAHGIYGKSLVQAERGDGSGMPLGYSGAMLFPLAALGLSSRRFRQRGRTFFAAAAAAGLLLGASAPGLVDLLTKLPGLVLALNYRLVFLASLGLSGLAAFGAEEIIRKLSLRRVLASTLAVILILGIAFLLARGVFVERGLPGRFLSSQLGYELGPLILFGLAAAGLRRSPSRVIGAALVCLVLQRGLEMRRTYPTLPREALAPPLPGLERLPRDAPYRVAAAADVFRPNASALYGLEDARGYESLVLARLADTFPLWSAPQPASFNRIDDLDRPFVSFLNVRFAIGSPGAPAPAGWREQSRSRAMSLFENPRVLPRAFVPKSIRYEKDPSRTLSEMRGASDFSQTAWVEQAARLPTEENGSALLDLHVVGPDLVVAADASRRAFVATSIPAWPGWRADSRGREVRVVVVDHAFIGFFVPPGRSLVRLHYQPRSWNAGLAALAIGLVAAASSAALGGRNVQPFAMHMKPQLREIR